MEKQRHGRRIPNRVLLCEAMSLFLPCVVLSTNYFSPGRWHNVSVAKRKLGSEPQPVAATVVPERDVVPSLTAVTMPRTKEEVFQKAAEAWYWAGYWSGVYRTMVCNFFFGYHASIG